MVVVHERTHKAGSMSSASHFVTTLLLHALRGVLEVVPSWGLVYACTSGVHWISWSD